MRIAQIAPPWVATPPRGPGGGVEWVVSWLTESLVELGHEVTLFATGDSRTSARLRHLYAQPVAGFGACEEIRHVAHACETIAGGGFDLIHNHTNGLALPLLCAAPLPVLTTVHLPFSPLGPSPHSSLMAALSPCHAFAAVSDRQRRLAPQLAWAGTVHHGLDLAGFPFRADKEGYLLFVGRLHPIKRPDLAIAAARAAGLPLKLAGPPLGAPDGYFEREIEPLLDTGGVEYLGTLGLREKAEIYGGARALLVPLQVEEAFGLVLLEALACGTPVIAFARGAVPEVVVDGEVGFVVDDLDGMVAAIDRLDTIDPRACRRHVEERFSRQRMAAGYLALYQRLLAGGATG